MLDYRIRSHHGRNRPLNFPVRISARASPSPSLLKSAPLLGHAQGEPVVLVRRGEELFAVGAGGGESGPSNTTSASPTWATPSATTECRSTATWLPATARSPTGAGRKLAVAVVHRDLEGLRAEVEFERANVERTTAASA
jgi:hypothetical protein